MKTEHRVDAGVTAVASGNVWRASLGLAGIALAGLGLLYSLAGVGLGQLLFAPQAQGSLLWRDGVVVGSAWVAQPVAGDGWFEPRPSAAGYDPMALAGSNLARSNPALHARIAQARSERAQREGVAPEQVPADLVTQSGSGADPHISVAAAQLQAPRVARQRGLPPERVLALVAQHSEPAQWGVLGEPRVNVLRLNLALDAEGR